MSQEEKKNLLVDAEMMVAKNTSDTTLSLWPQDLTEIDVKCGTEHVVIFKIKKYLLMMSKLFKVSFDDQENTFFEFPDIKPETFTLIKTYLEHHDGVQGYINPTPMAFEDMSQYCQDPWDATFINNLWNQSKMEVYNLTFASNYLDIACLFHLCCAKIGCIIHLTSDESQLENALIPPELIKLNKKKIT